MNEILTQIATACIPVLCLLITAGGAYIVALLRKKTAQLQQEVDNQTASKYIEMAHNAVSQAVAYTAQTYVDTLKAEGAFTKDKQLEAFHATKAMVLRILGETAEKALREIYGDFDAWLYTKIEDTCRTTNWQYYANASKKAAGAIEANGQSGEGETQESPAE